MLIADTVPDPDDPPTVRFAAALDVDQAAAVERAAGRHHAARDGEFWSRFPAAYPATRHAAPDGAP